MADPNNILLPDHKVILMLVCKAANTSIKRSVQEMLGLRERPDRVLPNPTKEEALDLRGQGWLVIGNVRHPVDRVVSCWRDKVARPFAPFTRQYPAEAWEGMSFEEFAAFVCRTPDQDSNQHWRGAAWDLCVDGEPVPELLIRFEHLESDWARAQDAMARRVCRPGPLPFVNRSRAEPPEVTEEARAALLERYAEDCQVFGYV